MQFQGSSVDCKTYCENSAARIEPGDFKTVFPVNSLSDHKLVCANIKFENQTIKIAAWNVLNRAYTAQHMSQSAGGQQLHGHAMASRDANVQNNRELEVLGRLFLGTSGYDIICLQEVSATLLDMISKKFHRFTDKDQQSLNERIFVDRVKFWADGSVKDCNVIIAKTARFKVISKQLFFNEDEKTPIYRFTFKIRNTGRNRGYFNLVSAHLPWDATKVLPQTFLSADTDGRPTIIAGDFNCGVRQPSYSNDIDALLRYSHPRFLFPGPDALVRNIGEHAQNGATHVCCMRNIGYKSERLLDVFDHIMIMLPEAPVSQ